jgi:hypothetical protein
MLKSKTALVHMIHMPYRFIEDHKLVLSDAG